MLSLAIADALTVLFREVKLASRQTLEAIIHTGFATRAGPRSLLTLQSFNSKAYHEPNPVSPALRLQSSENITLLVRWPKIRFNCGQDEELGTKIPPM